MNMDELHAAVCTSPDDDAPRHAYAAFMATYRPERAELVRLQLARHESDRVARKTFSVLGAREQQLLREHGEEWARYLRLFLVPPPVRGDLGCRFERGFIAHARVAIENVMGLGARLYEMAPIQHLDVTPGEGAPGRVLRAPGLDRLDSISLADLGLDNDDALALAECSALARASWVDLRNNKIGRVGVEAIARSPIFANKVRIELEGNPCNPVETAYFDPDGSVADRGAEVKPSSIEDAVGNRVPWLHYTWRHRDDEPDRYYARWFVGGR